MFRKITIVAVLALVGASASMVLAARNTRSGDIPSDDAQAAVVGDDSQAPLCGGGDHGVVVFDDGPGLGGGY